MISHQTSSAQSSWTAFDKIFVHQCCNIVFVWDDRLFDVSKWGTLEIEASETIWHFWSLTFWIYTNLSLCMFSVHCNMVSKTFTQYLVFSLDMLINQYFVIGCAYLNNCFVLDMVPQHCFITNKLPLHYFSVYNLWRVHIWCKYPNINQFLVARKNVQPSDKKTWSIWSK